MPETPAPMKMRVRWMAVRYGVALGMFAAALAARLALRSIWGTEYPFTMFYPAVALAAWFGGVGPGITVMLLAAGVASWLWLEPVGAFGIHGVADKVALTVFVAIGVLLSALAEAVHRARRRAEVAALAAVRLASIVRSSGDAIIGKTTEGIITSWNPGAERIFGYTASEAVGAPIARIVPPERLAEEEATLARVRRGDHVILDETVRVTKGGREIHMSIAVSPLRNEAGDVIGASTIARDISDRYAAEAERLDLLAREQAARAEAERVQRQTAFLAEASNLLAASLDYETTLRSVARVAVPYVADWCAVDLVAEDGSITRLAVAHLDPEKEAFARAWSEHHPIRLDARWGVPRVIRTGASELHTRLPEDWTERVARTPEERRAVAALGLRSMMIVPVSTRQGTAGAMTFVSAESGREYGPGDIALAEDLARRAGLALENSRLYRQAEAMRSAAEATNRAKDEFLAVLSHELRTPLTAMLGWLSILRTRRLGETQTERALETIERNTRLQARLINDLLDVSRIIAGKLRLEPVPVAVAPIVGEAIAAIQRDADVKGLAVRCRIEDRDATVLGESVRIHQIVMNLLSNAVKFTPAGGEVDVTMRRAGQRMELIVRDTGIGIEPDVLPYVFDRFQQADSSPTRRHGGLGLGLAIVRHLTELHGGSARAESDGAGRGATFVVELPTVTPGGRDAAHDAGLAAPAAAVSRPGSLKGVRILLVEDDTDTRELIAGVLAQAGADVLAAADVPDALERLVSYQVDLVLSDLGMPGRNGYDLVRELRAREHRHGRRPVPAIALTAYAGPEDRARALDAGFQMHVTKPIAPDELVEVLTSTIVRRDD